MLKEIFLPGRHPRLWRPGVDSFSPSQIPQVSRLAPGRGRRRCAPAVLERCFRPTLGYGGDPDDDAVVGGVREAHWEGANMDVTLRAKRPERSWPQLRTAIMVEAQQCAQLIQRHHHVAVHALQIGRVTDSTWHPLSRIRAAPGGTRCPPWRSPSRTTSWTDRSTRGGAGQGRRARPQRAETSWIGVPLGGQLDLRGSSTRASYNDALCAPHARRRGPGHGASCEVRNDAPSD